MNSRKIIRRRSQLNVYGVLPLGGATHHERRFHTNSWSVWRGKGWRWNPGWGANFLGGIWNEIATAKLFQSFCFVVLETFIKVGKTKGLARLEQSGSLTGPSGGSFDISNRKVELYVRTYSIQKIILFDSGYLVLKLGFLKNFLHSKLPPPPKEDLMQSYCSCFLQWELWAVTERHSWRHCLLPGSQNPGTLYKSFSSRTEKP